MEGEERCAFSRWKYSNYFELLSAKDENIKVRCTLLFSPLLATKYCQASKTQLCCNSKCFFKFEVKFTEQVSPGGVKQRAANKATSSTSAGGPAPPKQQKLDFSAKQVGESWIKLVGWYVVEEMLHLNKGESPLFGAIINKIPPTINAVLGIPVNNALPISEYWQNQLSFWCWGSGAVIGRCWM